MQVNCRVIQATSASVSNLMSQCYSGSACANENQEKLIGNC